jgi:hypothetical protein
MRDEPDLLRQLLSPRSLFPRRRRRAGRRPWDEQPDEPGKSWDEVPEEPGRSWDEAPPP